MDNDRHGGRLLCIAGQIFSRTFAVPIFHSLLTALVLMQEAVLEESKRALRRRMLSARAALSPRQRQFWSALIQAEAIRFASYLAAAEISLYSPIENEVDTRKILDDALARKKKVFYPRVGADNETWLFEIWAEADLCIGRFGVAEPAALKPLSWGVPDDDQGRVMFVPGVAFDLSGHRLGRGGGWYDRLLAMLQGHGVFVGLAFELQIVEQIAAEKWDQNVHYIITERRVIDCNFVTTVARK